MRPCRLIAFGLAALGLAAPAAAQPAKDTLSYELVSATMSQTAPRAGFVLIEFGRTILKRYLAAGNTTQPTGTEWTIETRERANPANVQTVSVTEVFVAADPALNRLVALKPSVPLDPATHQIRVRLLEGNYPEVIVAQPKKTGASGFYGPSKGKDDSDIYFKGLAVGTSGSAPAYTIDAKYAYEQSLGVQGGSLGGAVNYNVDKASDIGPDTITVTSTYSKVFVFDATRNWSSAVGARSLPTSTTPMPSPQTSSPPRQTAAYRPGRRASRCLARAVRRRWRAVLSRRAAMART